MSGRTTVMGERPHAEGLPWGVTWRLYAWVPALLIRGYKEAPLSVLDDAAGGCSVGGPAIVDDFGTLVLVGPLQ